MPGRVSVNPTTYKSRSGEFEQYAGFSGDTLSLDPNDFNRVYEYDVQKGEGVILGRGQSANPLQAQGFIGAQVMDNDPDADGVHERVSGQWRLTVRTTSNGRLVDVLASGDLEETVLFDSNGNRKSRDDLKELPRTGGEFATHEYRVCFEVRPDNAVTMDDSVAESEIQIDGFQAERSA